MELEEDDVFIGFYRALLLSSIKETWKTFYNLFVLMMGIFVFSFDPIEKKNY